jgi:hypothetical protein
MQFMNCATLQDIKCGNCKKTGHEYNDMAADMLAHIPPAPIDGVTTIDVEEAVAIETLEVGPAEVAPAEVAHAADDQAEEIDDSGQPEDEVIGMFPAVPGSWTGDETTLAELVGVRPKAKANRGKKGKAEGTPKGGKGKGKGKAKRQADADEIASAEESDERIVAAQVQPPAAPAPGGKAMGKGKGSDVKVNTFYCATCQQDFC